MQLLKSRSSLRIGKITETGGKVELFIAPPNQFLCADIPCP